MSVHDGNSDDTLHWPAAPLRSLVAVHMVVYTAASWRREVGLGGRAWMVSDGMWAAGAETGTTHNRLQLQAVLEAMRPLGPIGQLEVITAADYVVNCFERQWWAAWQQRAWRTKRNLVCPWFREVSLLDLGVAKDGRSADPRRDPEAPTTRPEPSNRPAQY